MSESIPKEIIGIAKASEWDNIKSFIKALLELTLEKDEEYSLIALNIIINNKKLDEYDTQIKTKDHINKINSITDFEKITLYQYSEYRRNIITVSKDDDIIVLTTQYMGPEIDHTNYFDFAIYIDSFNLPYFSDNKGNILDCHDILDITSEINLEGLKRQARKKRKAPTKKTTAKKPTPKKAPLKKTTAKKPTPKKAPLKKTTAKKPTPKKTPTKKTTAKKPTPKKAPTKKTTAKKPTPKKAPTKKTTAKKPTPKKAPLKKITAKKPTPKKAPLKKTAAKKPTPKKAPLKKTTAKKPTPIKKTARKPVPKKSTKKPTAKTT